MIPTPPNGQHLEHICDDLFDDQESRDIGSFKNRCAAAESEELSSRQGADPLTEPRGKALQIKAATMIESKQHIGMTQ